MRPGFTCIHVLEGAPVLCVEHDAPIDQTVTGWGVYCAARRHENPELRLVDLDAVPAAAQALAEHDSTLAEGHMATRTTAGDPWLVLPIPAEDEAA